MAPSVLRVEARCGNTGIITIKLCVRVGGLGAGFAAGRAIGPAGSAAVGMTKYRKDLKAGGHRRTRAIAKVSGPIAAGAVAGPAGSAADLPKPRTDTQLESRNFHCLQILI